MLRSIYRRGIRDLRQAINEPMQRWPINAFGGSGAAATYTLDAESGTFVLSGQLAGPMVGAPASFALTGQDAILTTAAILAGGTGAFTLSGQDATLTYSGASTFDPSTLFGSGEAGGAWDIQDTANLFEEITGASATTTPAVGDPVGTVVDISGNAEYAVSDATGNRPTLRQEGSGQYYLEFVQGGSFADMHLDLGSVNLAAAASTWTVCVAGQVTTGQDTIMFGGGDYLLACKSGDSSSSVNDSNISGVSGWRIGGSAGTFPATRDAAYVALNGTNRYFQMEYSIGTAGTITKLGGFTAANWHADMRIYRLLVINRTLTAGEKTDVDGWLSEALP